MPCRRQRKLNHPVKPIGGECSRQLDQYEDAGSRNFVVVKFSMIKTLREDEAGFHLTGNIAQMGNLRGFARSRECPENSGHHVVFMSLPKDITLTYQWSLMNSGHRTVKQKECNRTLEVKDSDISVQDCFGVYTDILTHIFHPDYHPQDQLLLPILFWTRHAVPDSARHAVAVLGSTPDLGRWRAANARVMFEVEPEHWASIIYLPQGFSFRYKFVVVDVTKHKRILYGEKKEHKVVVDDVREAEGEDTKPAKKGPAVRGVWTAAADSAVSIEQVEEQPMGSVASDISLGTRLSLATKQSDATVDDCDRGGAQADGRRDHRTLSAEQTKCLQELKEELVADVDEAEEGGVLFSDEVLNQQEDGKSTVASAQKCVQWLMNTEEGEVDSCNEEARDLVVIDIEDEELDPLLPEIKPRRYDATNMSAVDSGATADANEPDGDDTDPLDLTNAWAEIASRFQADETKGENGDSNNEMTDLKTETDAESGAVTDEERQQRNEEMEKVGDQSEEKEVADQLLVRKLDVPDVKVSGTVGQGVPIVEEPSHDAPPEEPGANSKQESDKKAEQAKAGQSRANSPQTTFLEVPPNPHLSSPSSNTSLKTSTIQLPCYRDKNASNSDVARKIKEKLPWIEELPEALTCRVLNSVGILNAARQRGIAKELTKLKQPQ